MGLISTEEHVKAIGREAGYTDREAAFLYLAAVHSGAFLTRQFVAFQGATQGGVVDQFIRKGVVRRHFSPLPTRNKTRIYQILKPIYGILGEPDNRNRRPKQSALQRLRLMSLDYVLDNPDKQFLTAESDKLEYLAGLGAPLSVCPGRTYHGLGRLRTPSTRYFIEKFPLFQRAEGVGFTYVCENSIQSFQTFLDRYMPLLVSIPAELVYVTTNEMLLKNVQAAFHAKLETRAAEDVDLATFELEFRERQAIETKGFELATTQELRRLRELRQRKYANLYPTWQAEGVAGIEKLMGKTARKRSNSVPFTAYVIPYQYSFL